MKLCLYFNIPSKYREEIYTRINNEYDCEWYFEESKEDIKPFDTSELSSCTVLHVIKLGGFYWTKGLLGLLRKDVDAYIMMGATRCLSLFVFLILKNLFFKKKKVLLWTHGYYGKEGFADKFMIKRPLLKMADGVLLYGNYARDLMVSDGFNPNKLYTIHNSLAYTKQLQLRKSSVASDIYKNHFGNTNPIVIFLGRLTAVKKLDLMVEAVALLKERGEHYNIVFVGDGSERQVLQDLVVSFSLEEQVWFYGSCYDEKQNAELVYNADLCVAPGNVGLTAIHTLMFGCPVITHNDFQWQMPEFESIIEGKTGMFFERNNVKSLADAISCWFDYSKSKRDIVRQACYAEIDSSWTPDYQMNIIANSLK